MREIALRCKLSNMEGSFVFSVMSVRAHADGTAIFHPVFISCPPCTFSCYKPQSPIVLKTASRCRLWKRRGNSFTFLNAGQPFRPTFLQRANSTRLSQNIFVLQSPQSQESRLHSTVSAARIPAPPAFLSTCPASLKAKAFLAPHLNEPFARSKPGRPAFSQRPAPAGGFRKSKKGRLAALKSSVVCVMEAAFGRASCRTGR